MKYLLKFLESQANSGFEEISQSLYERYRDGEGPVQELEIDNDCLKNINNFHVVKENQLTLSHDYEEEGLYMRNRFSYKLPLPDSDYIYLYTSFNISKFEDDWYLLKQDFILHGKAYLALYRGRGQAVGDKGPAWFSEQIEKLKKNNQLTHEYLNDDIEQLEAKYYLCSEITGLENCLNMIFR